MRARIVQKGFPDELTLKTTEKIKKILAKKEISVMDDQEVEEKADIVFAVGGDGTFVDACSRGDYLEGAMYVGVNTGTLGFLQNISPDKINEVVTRIQENSCIYELIDIGAAVITMDNDLTEYVDFFNEFQVYSKERCHVLKFEQNVQGQFLHKVRGDGILIATSMGDTGYSRSLGGAINLTGSSFLTSKLLAPIRSSAYEDFIENPLNFTNTEVIISDDTRNEAICMADSHPVFVTGNVRKIEIEISDCKIKKAMINLNQSKIQAIASKIIKK